MPVTTTTVPRAVRESPHPVRRAALAVFAKLWPIALAPAFFAEARRRSFAFVLAGVVGGIGGAAGDPPVSAGAPHAKDLNSSEAPSATLVASVMPPRPTSRTTTSTGSSANTAKPRVVTASK